MKKPLIIGMAGKMGSGKDTAGNYLINEYQFQRIAFADNLKEMAMKVFNLTYQQCYDQDLKMVNFKKPIKLDRGHIFSIMNYAENINGIVTKPQNISKLFNLIENKPVFKNPRELLQYLGTEILRDCVQEDYHAQVVKNVIEKNKWEKVVITDARFPNEREAIKQWGGFNVFIDRPSATSLGIKGHASENSLGDGSEYDFCVKNYSTLDDLYKNVEEAFSNIKQLANNAPNHDLFQV
jgi:hypothetical protein